MPPAFNLSQDQTLQFNLCLKLLLRRSQILLTRILHPYFLLCGRHLLFRTGCSRRPHLSSACLLKTFPCLHSALWLFRKRRIGIIHQLKSSCQEPIQNLQRHALYSAFLQHLYLYPLQQKLKNQDCLNALIG